MIRTENCEKFIETQKNQIKQSLFELSKKERCIKEKVDKERLISEQDVEDFTNAIVHIENMHKGILYYQLYFSISEPLNALCVSSHKKMNYIQDKKELVDFLSSCWLETFETAAREARDHSNNKTYKINMIINDKDTTIYDEIIFKGNFKKHNYTSDFFLSVCYIINQFFNELVVFLFNENIIKNRIFSQEKVMI